MNGIEYLIVALSAAVIAGYHIVLFYQTKKSPGRTVLGSAHAHRAVWVEKMISESDRILAVQTLRNWMMSTTYLASTAILIAAGLLGFLVSVDKLSTLVQELNLLGSQGQVLLTLKFLALIVNFFVTFFNFTLSLRFYNYVALEIGAADQAASAGDKAEITDHLNRAAAHYTWGMRGYYFCIPLLMWILGPLWLLAGAVLMTFVLYLHDHAVSR